jgi:hypothetical protein
VNVGWLIFWVAWAAVFIVGEGIALARTAKGDTASEQIWAWLKVTPGKTPASAALYRWPSYLVGALLVWLAGHFLFGWWT